MKRTIVVVGAGVIGSSLAFELSRRGADVTVIDAAEVGAVTSSATFAWVNSNDKTPEAYGELNLLGLQAHERARQQRSLGGGDWFHQVGNVQIAQTDEEMGAIESKVARLASNGYTAELLSNDEVRQLEPALHADQLKGGALYPQEGWVDTLTMCTRLLHQAQTLGARYHPFQKVEHVDSAGVTTVDADGSRARYDADVVVLAAGNGNRGILSGAGVAFPTIDPAAVDGAAGSGRAMVGLVSTTGPVDSGVRHIVRANGIAIRPARNGGVTFTDHPTGSQWDLDDPRIWTIPSILLERARTLYPALKATSTETVQLGTRVMPEDGLTIADWATDDHSIYSVATHSGVTLALFLAESVAEEIIDGNRHPALESFGLARFAGQ